eukprot:CAMPEP_0170462916 /NCGR_PEP_ID=MMETSP0123-20130129/8227_1 /TAXON_ID=182087 /ORGANISM="Favella ehrenbergii, Strain Fehren 1" /LENGTH=128 /DNA_ID=CAMNT_0010728225 /DNA_START=502 /DNA_END=888 /DNA_ORIENTATION=+
MFSCLMLAYSGPAAGDNILSRDGSGAVEAFLVDPTLEETQNLSNNLVLVTLVKKPTAPGSQGMEIDDSAAKDPLIIEKVSDALRTSYTCQLSNSLAHKSVTMSLGQMRQAMTKGREICERAVSQIKPE